MQTKSFSFLYLARSRPIFTTLGPVKNPHGHPFVNKGINWILGALSIRWKSEGYEGGDFLIGGGVTAIASFSLSLILQEQLLIMQ